jgi:hypothetical protein
LPLRAQSGPLSLSIEQLVATDMLAPHLHEDERCRSAGARDKHGEMECVALSLTAHLAKKHGLDQKAIDGKLGEYGLSIASMLTAQLKQNAKPSTAQHASDARVADAAAAHRRSERARRRMEGVPVQHKAAARPKPRGPRGGWVARSTSEGHRRLLGQEQEQGLVRVGVEPTGRTHVAQRAIDATVRNHTLQAKQLLRAANLGAANQGGRSLTAGAIASAAWDASLSTDSSILGRSRSVLGGMARIAERVGDLKREFAQAEWDAPSAPEWRGRRKLHAREHAAYDQVDARAEGSTAGWGPPAHHTEQYGWITESVDWVRHYGEAKRVAGVLSERVEARMLHVEETGTLPAGELPDAHKTGWAMLDLNSPPSRLGEALRGLLPHSASAGRRRLGEGYAERLREAPRAGVEEPGHAPRSVLGSFLDASIEGDDPFLAARHALQRREHRSRIRRLSDGFLGGAANALPLSAGPSVRGYPVSVDAGTETVRTLLFDTALVSCAASNCAHNPWPTPPLPARSATCTTSRAGRAASPAARPATARRGTCTTARTCASPRRRTPCRAWHRSARPWASPRTTTGARSSTRRCATRARSRRSSGR